MSEAVWQAAKDEAFAILRERAKSKVQQTILYSELVDQIQSIRMEAHDPRLARMLDQISRDEDKAGRGMLSVLVVQKGSGRPGAGFFTLARDLGRVARDPDEVWIAEFNHVIEAHHQ